MNCEIYICIQSWLQRLVTYSSCSCRFVETVFERIARAPHEKWPFQWLDESFGEVSYCICYLRIYLLLTSIKGSVDLLNDQV